MPRRRTPLSSMLAGAASVIDGMGSIFGSLFDTRPSPRMRRLLKDLDMPDAQRLRRDWEKVLGPQRPRSRGRRR